MAILKNEALFPSGEGDYSRPRHVILSGSDDGPVPGTNQMKTRMSEPFTFGFD